ncbi:MAG: NAD(P)-dependent glycerol-3-phosphate dehydrogenase [Deltaproteobacteria bacterium]|nr:NAD(P)-dependent glycerol-3-phosphate dehydrogenase [Deltaproteobacteria bacterium]MCB9786122.1 NAD(P)-dependent glycerol-3-phosphate dehydrogenase [Deltaproteobacteria bacterium]
MSESAPRTASVIGGGSWGTALAHILGTHGYETLLWMRDEDTVREVNEERTNRRYLGDAPIDPHVEATSDLARSATHAELILVVVPSKAFRQVANALGDHVVGDQILVSATKGLQEDGMKRMSQILREETCCRKVGALSGPNLAKEVLDGHPTSTVVASPFEEVIEKAERMLSGPRFRLYGNFDIVGVELAGALKNIYAIAGGVAAGLGFAANTQSALITRGLAEMCRFGKRFGADPATFQGLAGVGDMIATCTSTLSRNHTVGRLLAGGGKLEDIVESLGMVAEGVETTRVVHHYARRERIYMPIAEAVHRMLFEGATPESALTTLMERASRYEDLDSLIHTGPVAGDSVVESARLAALNRRLE